MSTQFIDGTIYHKRYSPKQHNFLYNFFMLDFDVNSIKELNVPRFFSLEKFNIFSFFTKDHFGSSNDFKQNVLELLEKFQITHYDTLRFITLPRVFGFVFNPVSIVLVLKEDTPTHLLAEVHNYNGGRVVYYIPLEEQNGSFIGSSSKDMYVSPFFDRVGEYSFKLQYTKTNFMLQISLFENQNKVLTSNLQGTIKEFSNTTIKQLFLKHTFLTMKVVTRTLYQSLKLKLKGLQWHSPTPIDQTRRF